MHPTICPILLQVLAVLLVFQGAVNATRVSQKGCYQRNVILDCKYYSEPKPGVPKMELIWYLKRTSGADIRLTRINESGKQKRYNNKPELMDRLMQHSNGSLEISSLYPDDEGVYQCKVRRGPISVETYQIELKVACGESTELKHEVCVEEEAVFECEAKHRSDPRNRGRLTWKRKTIIGNGSAYSLVDGIDGIKVNDNDSLILPKGRAEGIDRFRCQVKKKDRSNPDSHLIHVTSVKCRPATVKTTKGRAAMTTRQPVVCGGVRRDLIGSFQSPNFPNAYPANSHCKWNISVPQDYAAINITFEQVNIEHEENCQHDYITIHDELGNQIGCRICGKQNSPQRIQVKGMEAVVSFHSDTSVTKSGFKIRYQAVRTAEKSVL